MRNQTHFILLLVACAILSAACQKEKKKAKAPVLACGSDITINKNVTAREDIFKLRREFATYKHTDCATGKTKEVRETVKEPKDAYTIVASNLPQDGTLYTVSALNRTTCDFAPVKARKMTDNRMEVQFHSSKGTRRAELRKNTDNYIDYEFRRCLEQDVSKNCIRSEVAEKGTIVLHVQYTEFDHPGVREGNKCPDPQQQKP